jgi:DNA repair protein RecN (Recombination protein N)
MLRFLAVQNLAVIERLELEFSPGLTVLTGETGAGKSILVEAINLLVGGRASPDLVRTGEEAATVQAVFDAPDGSELLVRREVTSQGRSRAFLDGALTTAAGLRDRVLPLIDLHGQHEHQALLDPDTHLGVLDAYAGLGALRQEVATLFDHVKVCRDELATARADERDRDARLDLLTYQTAEIERADPKSGEDEQLAATRQILASAEKVQRLCAEGYAALYDSDAAALPTLGTVWKRVSELSAIDPAFGQYVEARDAIKSQLEDLAALLRDYAANLDASPARLQEVEDRLALLERLKRKYGPTLADVIARLDSMRRELQSLDRAGERVAELDGRLVAARDRYLAAARRLSCERHEAAARLSGALAVEVASLAMEHTRFEVRFEDDLPEDRWTAEGIDAGEFYVSPNPGEELRALARIASGGELSRVMLALKTLATTDAPGKTLIFDEVDAGIGGRVADAVGARLQALSADFQVFCITHLPQIAAHGDQQFLVTKSVRDRRTVTTVEPLQGMDRREAELARMIGGVTVSAGTLASAREMLLSRQRTAPAGEGRGSGAPVGTPGARAQGESETKTKAKADPERKAKAKVGGWLRDS